MKYKIYQNPTEFYDDPISYNKTFKGSSINETEFYEKYIKKANNILYFGSGSGRLLKSFLKINKSITGIEISKKMVLACKKLIPQAKILNLDVLKLNLKEKYDLIIAPYRFICHFDEKKLNTFYQITKSHLLPKGIFIGDIFSPFHPKDQNIEAEIQSINFKNNVIEKVYNTYNREDQICTEWVEKIDTIKDKYILTQMPWHYYYPKQLEKIAQKNKLKLKAFYGNFNKKPFTKKSTELIFEFKG